MTPRHRPITRELVCEALSFISPDVDRDTWVRVGMAIKAELGDAGADVWEQWSAASESYKAIDARDTWRSFKAGGRITIGTLFGLAKDAGFRFPESDAAPADPAAIAAEHESQAAERKRAQELEAAQYRERADKAATVARRMWAAASEQGSSKYLERKGVQAHGVRFEADGTVLVPMRDAAGEIQNLQRIFATAPASGPAKRFLAGGRKTGLRHVLGAVDGAPVLLLAEGLATASTLHEATARPVVVAFDAGNLVHVARSLRESFAEVPLLVCGDDDRETFEKTGKNTGRDKAAAAARAARAPAATVFADQLPAGGTDFNDMAAHSGLAAVRGLVEAACARLLSESAQQAAKSGAGARERASPPPRPTSDDGVAHKGGDESPPIWDPFSVTPEGVWHTARDAEGNLKKPQWVCTRLVVTALTRADDTNGWGYLLEFADSDRNPKTWAMPSAMLSGDSSEWAGRLRDMGLRIGPGPQARNLLARYIDTRQPEARVMCTSVVGWHGPVFVLPSASIGTTECRRYVFQSESGMEDNFRRHGTLQEWQREVAALCVGNSRLAFAVCCAFAGPMLRLAGMEGGGFHLRGNSSIGKTTGLKVATSVWGRPTYMQRWRTTDNALEATAVQHSDGLLILDEIGQIDGRVLGECAYMLANGQEKGRATRGGLARKKRTWLTLFLSAGEISMADHMAEAGKRVRAGQEIRMVDVPLDVGNGMGGIEDCHGKGGPAQLADAVVAAGAKHYGVAGRAWLEHACEHFDALGPQLLELLDDYRDAIVPEAASAQVRRVGSRFALVAAAGELASRAGITAWPAGESLRAVRQCFNAWLASRGHMDNGEDAGMLRQVKQFLELNGEGRFSWFHRAMDDHTPKTLNRAGFRRLLGADGKAVRSNADHQTEYGERMSPADGEQALVEHFVLREVFTREVCRGFDAEAVAKLLQQRGHLRHDKGRLQLKAQLPGIGKVWCYSIKPTLFEDDL